MSGTYAGGLKAKEKNLAKDPNWYGVIGAIGGKNSNNGGFASEKVGKDGLTGAQRAKIAGSIGGRISRRGKPKRKNSAEIRKKYTSLIKDWKKMFN